METAAEAPTTMEAATKAATAAATESATKAAATTSASYLNDETVVRVAAAKCQLRKRTGNLRGGWKGAGQKKGGPKHRSAQTASETETHVMPPFVWSPRINDNVVGWACQWPLGQ
jgi:hypothetical protein